MILARTDLTAPDSAARLRELGELADRLGASDLARDAAEAATRVAEGRFYVACVGQFKRGKSTLLNALVGDPVLPTGVVPVTSAITVLRHGQRAVRVHFDDGQAAEIPVEAIADYVTERKNPENRKRVRVVEVFLPSALLAHGMCLVDTPGLGSAFGGNAAVTREFVPHIDAALVVVGADPPISGDEVELAEKVAANARHLLVVLNKADRLTEHERLEGARFAVEVLSSKLHRPIGRIYEVSAQERMDGRTTRDWGELSGALDGLARASGSDLVAASEARAVERIGRALLEEISERRDALHRPLEESERRLVLLDKHVAAAERALEDLGVLLQAHQWTLTRTFRDRQAAFLRPAQDAARSALAQRVRSMAPRRLQLRRAAAHAARDVSSEIIERFRAQLEPEAERLYRDATERFVTLANEFLGRVSRTPGMERLPNALGPEIGFRVQGHLQYTELLYRETRTPLGWMIDALRPPEAAFRAAVRSAGDYLDALVESNSSRIANDLVERTAASRERLEAEIRALLRELSLRAQRALSEARLRVSEGRGAVEEELSRLQRLGTQVESLLAGRSKGENT